MTRPMYEPTPSRTDAVLGYGSDQLFRRPAPRADVESVWGYISWLDGSNVPTGTWWQPDDDAMDWTQAYTSPDADAGGAITPNLSTGVVTCDNDVGGLHYLWRCHAIVSWQDATPAAGTWLGTRISPLAAGSPVANPTSEGWAPADKAIGDGAIGAFTHESYHTPTASSVTFQVSVFQDTGGDLFCNFIVLYIVRDEVFDTTNGTFYP